MLSQKEFRYCTDCITVHGKYWLKTLDKFKGQPVQYLEIGVLEGRTFNWVFENFLTHRKSRATVVDVFFDLDMQQNFMHNLSLAGNRRRTRIVRGFSQQALRTLEINSFDIIYIDGSHEGSDVLADGVQAWELLKVGGVMIFDDYLLDEEEYVVQPKKAIDAFLEIYGHELRILHKDEQIHIEKLKTKPVI